MELLRQARSQTAVPAQGSADAPLGAGTDDSQTPHGTELLTWAVKMALADNQLDNRERALLERVARHRHVSPQQLEMLIDAAQQGKLDAPKPASHEQAHDWLVAMADMSLSDGTVHREEYKLLCQAGSQLNLSAHDVKLLLRRRQKDMYQAARRRLREAKRGN